MDSEPSRNLKIAKTFNSRKQPVVAAFRVSVEKRCVLCEVRTLYQAIMSVIFKFQAQAEEIVEHTVFHMTQQTAN